MKYKRKERVEWINRFLFNFRELASAIFGQVLLNSILENGFIKILIFFLDCEGNIYFIVVVAIMENLLVILDHNLSTSSGGNAVKMHLLRSQPN